MGAVVLSQIILAALEEKFECIRIVAVYGMEEHIRSGESFVDDTTCGTTDDVQCENGTSAFISEGTINRRGDSSV
jgi:hypothetical protein